MVKKRAEVGKTGRYIAKCEPSIDSIGGISPPLPPYYSAPGHKYTIKTPKVKRTSYAHMVKFQAAIFIKTQQQ
jgi:hypothetical protein